MSEKLTRKQKRARAELKRKELVSQVFDYMTSKVKDCSVDGMLDLRAWGITGENYIHKLLKERPQDSELIHQVSRRVEQILVECVKAMHAEMEKEK